MSNDVNVDPDQAPARGCLNGILWGALFWGALAVMAVAAYWRFR